MGYNIARSFSGNFQLTYICSGENIYRRRIQVMQVQNGTDLLYDRAEYGAAPALRLRVLPNGEKVRCHLFARHARF